MERQCDGVGGERKGRQAPPPNPSKRPPENTKRETEQHWTGQGEQAVPVRGHAGSQVRCGCSAELNKLYRGSVGGGRGWRRAAPQRPTPGRATKTGQERQRRDWAGRREGRGGGAGPQQLQRSGAGAGQLDGCPQWRLEGRPQPCFWRRHASRHQAVTTRSPLRHRNQSPSGSSGWASAACCPCPASCAP